MPLGDVARSSDGWEVSVLSVAPNASDAVLAENRFNDPPREGRQFHLVTVRAKYVGTGSTRFDGSFRLRALGAGGVVYTTFENGCGVLPDALPDPEVFTGGEITGNECWEIESLDVGSLVMLLDGPAFSFGTQERIWFALR